MRILVNALSVTNLSGKHVLFGHLSQITKWTGDSHRYLVLFHHGNKGICSDMGKQVEWIECPKFTSSWAARTAWERTVLPNKAKKLEVAFMLLPTGAIVPSFPLPQVSYAMNPWALVPEAEKKPAERVKASFQRIGYREAMKNAGMMLFLSEYMRQLFREKTGVKEKASDVAYTGLDDSLFSAAEQTRSHVSKDDWQILSVSVMAPHKGVETLLEALKRLREAYGVPARLCLVGQWPDRDYEKRMKRFAADLRLDESVEFRGHASLEDLYRYYAESKVFCLMSRCESFGIPAVEAQAFGTPTVSSNCCAIPEVCGSGGIYPKANDVEGTADALARLLTDGAAWQELSEAARQNAERYRWETCSRPLMRMFEVIGN